MPPSTPPALLRSRLVGAALALLIACLAAPSSARAGCSHGGRIGSDGPDHFARLRDAGAIEDASRHERPASPGGCTGPYCSDRSELPPAPASVIEPRPSQWAMIDAPRPTVGATWAPSRPSECGLRPILAADEVFHPPR